MSPGRSSIPREQSAQSSTAIITTHAGALLYNLESEERPQQVIFHKVEHLETSFRWLEEQSVEHNESEYADTSTIVRKSRSS
jgi:hypothetical protein